jgi:hypothetical protein
LLVSSTRESLVSYGKCDSKFIKEDLKRGKEDLTFQVIWKNPRKTPFPHGEGGKLQVSLLEG